MTMAVPMLIHRPRPKPCPRGVADAVPVSAAAIRRDARLAAQFLHIRHGGFDRSERRSRVRRQTGRPPRRFGDTGAGQWVRCRRRSWPAGQRLQFNPLMRICHDIMPGGGGQSAAGHFLHWRVVVIAEPDRADIIAGEADEPGVLVAVCRPGLPGDLDIVELRTSSGAGQDDLHQHRIHGLDRVRIDDLARRRGVAVVPVDHLAAAVGDLHRRIRGRAQAAIGESAIGRSHIDHRDFGGADRQGDRIGQAASSGPSCARSR